MSRLRSCPYPLPHKEQRECVYCHRAKNIKLTELNETLKTIKTKPRRNRNVLFYDNTIPDITPANTPSIRTSGIQYTTITTTTGGTVISPGSVSSDWLTSFPGGAGNDE